MLTLFLLGDLRLERDGAAILTGRRKPLALLAFMARRGTRPSSREELAALLWGTNDDASARKSLRQCLSELRAEGLTFAESDAGIALPPGTLVTDVTQFEADVRAGAWPQAIARWHGDVIPSGESLGGADWQHWLDGERSTLRRQLAMAFDNLTSDAERRGEWSRALETATQWRAALPDDSRGWCREIHALQATGRITDAVARVEEAERYFRNDLGTSVPDDLARLSRVLSRVGLVSGTPAASLLTPDMTGRGRAMDVLARARAVTRLGEGRTVLVIAAEGLGKTRLVREFTRSTRSADRDVIIIEAPANPSNRSRPFSFLQGIVEPLAEQDAIAGCAPETLATLADAAPAIRAHFRHLPSSGSGNLAGALRSALSEVARASTVVLLLDDLPDADQESQSIIASMLLSPVAGTLFVATGRPVSWRASPLLAHLSTRTDVEQCPLEPLDADGTRAVLSSMAPLTPAALDSLTTTLHRQSGGIPGLLTSALTNLVITRVLTADDTGTWSAAPGVDYAVVPAAIEERWRARCAEFSADTRHVVDAAAILCSAATRETGLRELEELAGIPSEQFRIALDSLRAAGVVRVSDARTWFAADLFRQLAYDAQAPSRRRAMHASAAKRLRWTSDAGAKEAAASHRKLSGQRISVRVIGTAFAGLMMLVAVGWYSTRNSAARVPPRSPVILADVQNLTDDTTFDQTLYLAASIGLQQSRQVSLFPRSRIRETLVRMRRPGADSVLDEALAREIAVRENLRRVVHLSVARVEDNYLLAGRIIDPSSGADLFTHQERVNDRNQVLDALDGVLNRLRRGVGESADTITASSSPLPQVTTASLPALKAYANALKAFNARRYQEAQVAYNTAVRLDSTFALAWLGLADLQYQLANDRSAAYAAIGMAERHSQRLTERERLRLAQASAGYRGNTVEELRNAEQLARSFPETMTWFNVGNMQMRRRNCPEALRSFGNALGFDSSFVAAHINVATCHQFLGAPEQAIRAYNRAWHVDSLSLYQGGINHEFGVALVRGGQTDSALAVYSRMSRRPVLQDQQFGHRSLGYHSSWLGKWRLATAHFDSAAARAREGRTPLSEFRNRILQADVLLTAQQQARARQVLEEAWLLREKTPIAPAFAMYAGLAYVRAGQIDRANSMLRTIEASMNEASSDDRTVRSILAARIALAQNRIAAARSALESATDTTRSDYTLPALIDAMLASGRRDSALVAASRFEGRAVFGIDAQDAWLRNLMVKARIAEELGHIAEAATAYGRLEAQLLSGDSDHPLLVESRRGLARLALTDDRKRR